MLRYPIATPVDENLAAGSYKMNLNASGSSSGVCLYRLKAGNFIQTKKIVVVKYQS